MAARRRKGGKSAGRARRKGVRPKGTSATRKRKKPATRKRGPGQRRAARKPRAPARKRRTPARTAARAEARAGARERLAAGVPIEIGVVVHWFPRASAAVVALSHPIHVGDTIHVRGRSTDFVQQVASLALEGAPVREGAPPQELGVRLLARARPGDRVYRVSW